MTTSPFVLPDHRISLVEAQLSRSELYRTTDMDALGYPLDATAAKLEALASEGLEFLETQRNGSQQEILDALVARSKECGNKVIWNIFSFHAGPEYAGVVIARNGEVTTLNGHPYPRTETDPNLIRFQQVKAFPLLAGGLEQIKVHVHAQDGATKKAEELVREGCSSLLEDCDALAKTFAKYGNVANSFDPDHKVRRTLDEARVLLLLLEARSIMHSTPEMADRMEGVVDFSMEMICRRLDQVLNVFLSQSIREPLAHQSVFRSETE